MCSLTLIAREDGYLLGMNRDERIARGAGLPPATRVIGRRKAMYPTDGTDGTWIGSNDQGITLALLMQGKSAVEERSFQRFSEPGLLLSSIRELRTWICADSSRFAWLLSSRLRKRLRNGVGIQRKSKYCIISGKAVYGAPRACRMSTPKICAGGLPTTLQANPVVSPHSGFVVSMHPTPLDRTASVFIGAMWKH